MSSNVKRSFQGNNQTRQNKTRQNKPQESQRQGVRNNLPRSNIQQNVRRSQNRINQIKSPFASDQTKTIANRNTQKKRAVGQIPLSDRQHSKLKVNQKQSSGVKQDSGFKLKPISQKKVQQQRKTLNKSKQQVNKPNQFNRKNKSKDDITKIFDFKQNQEFF